MPGPPGVLSPRLVTPVGRVRVGVVVRSGDDEVRGLVVLGVVRGLVVGALGRVVGVLWVGALGRAVGVLVLRLGAGVALRLGADTLLRLGLALELRLGLALELRLGEE